jgi:protocatechuate 3,4-dioxygenase beta subunit
MRYHVIAHTAQGGNHVAPKYNLQTLFSRRELLGLLGAGGAAFVAACGGNGKSSPTATGIQTAESTSTVIATSANVTPSSLACIATPQETEGPYFVDEQLGRSDITTDPSNGTAVDGTPLKLTIRAFRVESGACTPLSGATIDIWHCNAEGLYSDESANNTVGQKFLRGYQTTDKSGTVTFLTIFPGWYQGRTVHIHFKVRVYDGNTKTYEYTSQLFFDDALTDEVFSASPYNARGDRTTRNSNDGIFTGASTNGSVSSNSGEQLTVALTKSGSGYGGSFDFGIDFSRTVNDNLGGGPPGGA